MLQYSTVEPRTLEILKTLMRIPELAKFCLVGGTALSLYYGHRKSIDIDLFSLSDFKNEDLIEPLTRNCPGFAYRSTNNPIGLFCFIDDIKVDFVKHFQHPLLRPVNKVDGIRIMSPEDIAAMKVAALLRRAVKKDFWDVAELLQHFTVNDFTDFYQQKYPSQQLIISIPHALTYFADADESEDPVSLKNQTWSSVKKTIQKKVNQFLK